MRRDALAVAMTCVHVLVSGKVQGVFYRDTTKQEARRLGLRGWVRNLRDGRVELVAEGSDAAVAQLLAWCEHGPPLAAPTFVDRADHVADELPDPFEIWSTAAAPHVRG